MCHPVPRAHAPSCVSLPRPLIPAHPPISHRTIRPEVLTSYIRKKKRAEAKVALELGARGEALLGQAAPGAHDAPEQAQKLGVQQRRRFFVEGLARAYARDEGHLRGHQLAATPAGERLARAPPLAPDEEAAAGGAAQVRRPELALLPLREESRVEHRQVALDLCKGSGEPALHSDDHLGGARGGRARVACLANISSAYTLDATLHCMKVSE